jgi:hypothetical protein
LGSGSGLEKRVLSPSQRSLRAQIAANARWSREDRTTASDRQRQVILRRFEDQVDPDRKLSAEERDKRARNALAAHMARLAFKSAKARKAAS